MASYLIRADDKQMQRWRDAAGEGTFSEWVRDALDAAADGKSITRRQRSAIKRAIAAAVDSADC